MQTISEKLLAECRSNKVDIEVAFGDFPMQTISEKLLAECRSNKADIEVVRGYLEQEDCDVNIRKNVDLSVCIMMCGYLFVMALVL